MTSKERLLASLRGDAVDRPPVSFYEIDGYRQNPDDPDVCLIGGTNAALWITDNAAAIIAQLEHDISELPHRRGIVISSAGVMPALCSPGTIRRVCEWVHGVA